MADNSKPMKKPGTKESGSGCKCGIPNCQGHRIVNGKALIVQHPLLMKRREDLTMAEEKEQDGTLRMMKKLGIPLTRENYLNMDYAGNPPEEIGPEIEATLPKEIRDKDMIDEKEE